MNPAIPSIDQLKEMALPAPVSYAPQTWGWWALLTLLVLSLLLVSARRYWQWRRDRYRREALARLAELQQRSNDLNALRELPELLKRVALSMPAPRAPCRSCRRLRSFSGVETAEDQKIAAFGSSYRGTVAALGKEDWQAFLQRHSKQTLPADFSQQLSLLAYAPDATLRAMPNEQRQLLFSTCKTWVERHHVAA
ncbi:DUF4381 domain-containing protein [Pseudomonas sp. PDM27]|uniref:DUF4381 domain-containing protein n=1 Tax=Pseudomonas sp. PDM27 TaxID=2854769 RepID=UPI001C468AAF|nr:DUF4381 domain-containing protein [Pseudomonas sp. PDM27]MBV7570933.1 DUF4381 domain-containing protein [Pseudomonas sp. PDM27]